MSILAADRIAQQRHVFREGLRTDGEGKNAESDKDRFHVQVVLVQVALIDLETAMHDIRLADVGSVETRSSALIGVGSSM